MLLFTIHIEKGGSIFTYNLFISRFQCTPTWGHSRWWKNHEKRFTTDMAKCLVKYPHTHTHRESFPLPIPGSDSCLSEISFSSLLFQAKAGWFEPEVFQRQKKHLGFVSSSLLFLGLAERILCHAESCWLPSTFSITTVKTEQIDTPKYGFSLHSKLMFLWHGICRNSNCHSFSSDGLSEIR